MALCRRDVYTTSGWYPSATSCLAACRAMASPFAVKSLSYHPVKVPLALKVDSPLCKSTRAPGRVAGASLFSVPTRMCGIPFQEEIRRPCVMENSSCSPFRLCWTCLGDKQRLRSSKSSRMVDLFTIIGPFGSRMLGWHGRRRGCAGVERENKMTRTLLTDRKIFIHSHPCMELRSQRFRRHCLAPVTWEVWKGAATVAVPGIRSIL